MLEMQMMPTFCSREIAQAVKHNPSCNSVDCTSQVNSKLFQDSKNYLLAESGQRRLLQMYLAKQALNNVVINNMKRHDSLL